MKSLACLLILPACLSAQSNQCTTAAHFDLSGPSWNGWSPDSSNARFQLASAAQIPADQVTKLKLKWAFGFPGAKAVLGAPVVAGGRVFLGVDTGIVYSLDAGTGCLYWSFRADAGVRSAVTVARLAEKYVAYFGDLKANAYALDAATGEMLWKVHVDDHARALITAAPKVFEGRVYVPVASGEEGAGVNPNYPCCTFRGSVVALDAATGRQVWKTFTIVEEPKQVGKNSNGAARWTPAGGGVWNSPTVDPQRRVLYVGTGDAYSEPAAKTTDAILALDLNTGKIVWSVQDTENDAWLAGCNGVRPNGAGPSENCPKTLGPDHDFGSSPILKTIADGRTLLIAGQKSGNVWAHDPDRKGAVLWRTALINNTTEFGGKIVWGGAADDQNAYFGLGPGGIAAVQLRDGERKWFTRLEPAPGVAAHPGQDGALSAIPGVVFSGGFDGVLRALAADTGRVLWEYDTVRDFPTVNGVAAKGGSLSVAGPTVAAGMLFAGSGYVGVRNGMPGNALLAFSLQ